MWNRFPGSACLAWAGLCTGLLLVGCSKGPAAATKKESGQPRAVEVTAAAIRPMERSITVTGTLLAQERSILSAKVSGRLMELSVDIGSIVKQGDVLAQIEPRDYELGLQQAVAALAQARTTIGLPANGTNDDITVSEVNAVRQAKAVLDEAVKNRERIQSLSRSGIASRSELDTVEAAYEVASTKYAVAEEEAKARIATVAQRRAELRLAEKRLADASLRAPFDGVVQSRPANVGEYLTAGTPTVELVKNNPLRLRLQVPERDAALVRPGQEVRLFAAGVTNQYTGRLERLSPALNESDRMLTVEADIPAQGALRPGLFARAQIVITKDDPALCVPENAVITFAGLQKAVLVDAGKALETVIVTGRRVPGWVEVVEGLKEGQEVVLNPSGLRTGIPVTLRGAAEGRTNARATP